MDSRTFLAMLAALLVWSVIVGLVLWKTYETQVAPELAEAKASLAKGPAGLLGL